MMSSSHAEPSVVSPVAIFFAYLEPISFCTAGLVFCMYCFVYLCTAVFVYLSTAMFHCVFTAVLKTSCCFAL